MPTAPSRPGVATARQLQGKELCYNNINDTDAAFELRRRVRREPPPSSIIKHANPCGVAVAARPVRGLSAARWPAIRVSAFGGIVALNRTLDAATAEEIAKLFLEVVIAPDADEEALAVLRHARRTCACCWPARCPIRRAAGMTLKSVAGGFLVQTRDNGRVTPPDLQGRDQARADATQELRDLLFAFTVAKHVKSNAIVYAKDGATVGVGAGQMNRLRLLAHRRLQGGRSRRGGGLGRKPRDRPVVASDAFFPFADGLLAAAEAGATAVIQPGGSMRDEEVIEAADERGLAMVFTGMRHFRH